MRPIKFRAWDEGNKVMHNDFQFVRTGIEGNDWILFVSDKQPIGGDIDWRENPYFAQQLKLMQYTGLKDRNGVEIFEGDIIACSIEGELYSNRDVVQFSEGCFRFRYRTVPIQAWLDKVPGGHEVTVIGNIYEHPHLLEQSSPSGA